MSIIISNNRRTNFFIKQKKQNADNKIKIGLNLVFTSLDEHETQHLTQNDVNEYLIENIFYKTIKHT